MGDSCLVRIFPMSEKAQIVFVNNHLAILDKAYVNLLEYVGHN